MEAKQVHSWLDRLQVEKLTGHLMLDHLALVVFVAEVLGLVVINDDVVTVNESGDLGIALALGLVDALYETDAE